MPNKILITGGGGLLGSEISISESLSPSKRELNILEYESLSKFIKTNKIKKIIHCAAKVGGVVANSKNMYDFFMQNIQMNINITRACCEHNLNGSIFILSTCVLPEKSPLPYREEYLHDGEPHFTNYGYAYAKRMLEVGSRSMLDQYGIKTTCLIPCNLYGKNDNYNIEDGHVIPGLIHKCFLAKKENKNLEVWGTGRPEREFIYAGDFARIIEKVCNEDIHHIGRMIISSAESVSIKSLVDIIAKKMNFNGSVVFDDSKPDGIIKKPTDNSVFKNIFSDFKWTPLDEGIEKTVDFFLKNQDIIRK